MKVGVEYRNDMVPRLKYARHGDAGADLVSADKSYLIVPARGTAVVPTGVSLRLPDGFAAFVHPRSGLAAREGLTVLNAPGTVDAGYRGEIKVILHNTRDEDYWVWQYDKIAQLVIQRVERAEFVETDVTADQTERGSNGFGSTGIHYEPGLPQGFYTVQMRDGTVGNDGNARQR